MRGSDKRSRELFSYVDLEQRVRQDHPLRAIRSLTDAALEALSADFAALCSGLGRPSIPPEMLLNDAVAGILFDSLGASAHGAVGVRSAVSLVPRASGSMIRYGIIRPGTVSN